MGFWNFVKTGASEFSASNSDAIIQPHLSDLLDAAQKDYDYSASTPEALSQTPFSIIGTPGWDSKWSGSDNFAKKADLLLKKCPVSKACIEIRAQGIQDIVLKVEGKLTKQLIASPNTVDKTMSAALKSWEVQLSIGGDLYLFYDNRVPGKPQVSSLRQDFMWNNIKAQRYEYVPGRLTGAEHRPELIFPYDASGICTGAQIRRGKTYVPLDGALQRISYYDPTSPLEGAGAGDSALRAIDIYLLCDDLIQRKFKSGGSKNGYLRAPQVRTAAELARVKEELGSLNTDGNLSVLAGGMDFLAAQMSFGELDLVNIRDAAAKAICTAFGVNSTMINIGDATYANVRGMDKVFYRNFIGPEANWLIGQLEWGVRKFVDANGSIEVDETGIQHVQEDILDALTKISTAGVATLNELRVTIGLPARSGPEGDEIVGGKSTPNPEGTGLGQPEEKPKGPVSFNADSGSRGDNNER